MRRQIAKIDTHRCLTDQIVAAIGIGNKGWQRPWQSSSYILTRPVNVASGMPYSGMNVLALWTASAANGFSHGLWGTYRQWQERGAQVCKGARSSVIVVYKQMEQRSEEGRTGARSGVLVRSFFVFNVAQVSGFELPEMPMPVHDRIDPLSAVEAFIAAIGAEIKFGGDEAFYDPATDVIWMPDRSRFIGSDTSSPTEAWYSVLLHELAHWSGGKRRLARDLSNRFGADAYAMEELVAELAAAFLCADLCITSTPRPDHVAYLAGWLSVIQADKRAIFLATSLASQAANYLMGLSDRPR